MSDVQTANSNPVTKAKALLDGGENLLLTERQMVRQVREYAEKNGISAENAQSYISYLNGTGGLPAWLGQAGADGVLHANSREIFAVNVIKNDRDAHLAAFRAAAGAEGLNAETAVAEMRRTLTGADPKADETMIAMLNAMGSRGGKPLSNHFTDLAYPGVGNAYFLGIDKPETVKRIAENAWNKAGEFFTAAKDKAAEVAAPVIGGAQAAAEGATEQGGSWFGNATNWVKDKTKDLSFGGIAGSLGVGALFYLIANALGGNSWFGKIVGVMAGVFGAVLGFRTFGGHSNENLPSALASGRGLQYDGPVQPNPALLRNQDRGQERQESGRQLHGAAADKYYGPADRNEDGKTTAQELYDYNRRLQRSSEQYGKPGPFVPVEPTSAVVPNAAPQNARGFVGRGQ